MQSRLIRALLHVVQSPETVFQAPDALLEFHRDCALRLREGRTGISVTPEPKNGVRACLGNVLGQPQKISCIN